MGYDAKLPLTKHAGSGWESVNTAAGIVRQDLTILLMTAPGERIMNPDFGVGLRRFLFEPMIRPTFGAIEDRIKSQVKKYLPFITIQNIAFGSALDSGPDAVLTDLDPNALSITISYSFGRGNSDEITVSS